jgi:hypothetical protein
MEARNSSRVLELLQCGTLNLSENEKGELLLWAVGTLERDV